MVERLHIKDCVGLYEENDVYTVVTVMVVRRERYERNKI